MNPKKYWLEGGIIGIIIIILAFVIFVVTGTEYSQIDKELLHILRLDKLVWIRIIKHFIKGIIEFFVIGAVVGWVYGKIFGQKEHNLIT